MDKRKVPTVPYFPYRSSGIPWGITTRFMPLQQVGREHGGALSGSSVKGFPQDVENRILQEGVIIKRLPDIYAKPEVALPESFTLFTACSLAFPNINTWVTVYNRHIEVNRKLVIKDMNVAFKNPYVMKIFEVRFIKNGLPEDRIITFNRDCGCPYPCGNIAILGEADIQIQMQRIRSGWVMSDFHLTVLGYEVPDAIPPDQRMGK